MNISVARPDETEYAAYYGRYISLVPPEDIVFVLRNQVIETLNLLRSIPESKRNFRYAPDKWSINQLVGHLIDGERIFSYRALRFARKDPTNLAGFEQDDYVRNASFDDCSLAELATEFEHVRHATALFFKHLNDEAWERRGTANDNEISVRAIAFVIAGHELHHRSVLSSKYLNV